MAVTQEQIFIPGVKIKDTNTGLIGEALVVRYHIDGSAKVQIRLVDDQQYMADLEKVEIVK